MSPSHAPSPRTGSANPARLLTLSLLALTAIGCGDREKDSGEPTCSPVAEIPYDGIDQDCDGTDLTDADGDGHDATAMGGDDCDDADASVHPDATETWYDGIDSDCSGGSDDDADGDGHDAPLDCDDTDASIHPDATETWYDGIDQDCDGSIDEPDAYACPDGTGDYLTIQEAVDGAPDGGTVVICPGTYTEEVVIEDRVLTIQGGGEAPGDVIIDASAGGPGFLVTGEGAEVDIRWVGIVGDELTDQRA